MFKRLCTVAFATAAVTFNTGMVLAGDYPDIATVDGLSADVAPAGAQLFPVDPPLHVASYDAGASPDVAVPDPVDPPPGNFKRTMWGYEAAASNARIFQYQFGAGGTPPLVLNATCVPVHKAGFTTSQNGRGIAWDPLTNTLWNSHVILPGFNGDGFIHRNSLPATGCAPIEDLPFADGPGGTVQDDIGAIDVDEATKHLWVAGYKPVSTGGALLSFIYKVNRNTGQVIDSCAIPFRGGGEGNDTLAVFRDTSLPGSSKYLLTDAGELATAPHSYAVIDQSDCHGGQVVTPVTEFLVTTPGGVSGIDMEWPGLVNANALTGNVHNNHDQPFTASTLLGNGAGQIEDISLCGFRAKFGGDGNDMCPLP